PSAGHSQSDASRRQQPSLDRPSTLSRPQPVRRLSTAAAFPGPTLHPQPATASQTPLVGSSLPWTVPPPSAGHSQSDASRRHQTSLYPPSTLSRPQPVRRLSSAPSSPLPPLHPQPATASQTPLDGSSLPWTVPPPSAGHSQSDASR